MIKSKSKRISNNKFKRLFGISKNVYKKIIEILEEAMQNQRKRGGSPNKLSVEEMLKMALEYWKEKGFCQDLDEEKISYLITYFHNENIKNNKPNPNIIEMMKDKSREGKIKIIKIFHDAFLFDIIYNKLVEIKEKILKENNFEIILDQLPFHKFDIDVIDSF
jgi:hypothetical protein